MLDSVARVGDPTVVVKDPVAVLSAFGVWANRRVDSNVEIFAARFGADKRHGALMMVYWIIRRDLDMSHPLEDKKALEVTTVHAAKCVCVRNVTSKQCTRSVVRITPVSKCCTALKSSGARHICIERDGKQLGLNRKLLPTAHDGERPKQH